MTTTALALLAVVAAVQDQQVGARTKAMGGSYTAFEDDPVSVWLNPAGTATQPDGFAIAYQTYPTYEFALDAALLGGGEPDGVARQGWNDPPFIPSYLGIVMQAGDPENPMAFGFCFASPYQLKFPFSLIADNDVPGADFEQTFYRFRASFAYDFRINPEGFLTHVAAGVAVDVGVSNLYFREYQAEAFSVPIQVDRTETGLGGGVGLLVGLYDDTKSFKVNLGLAWQSLIRYDFSADENFSPQFDSPNQYQAGLTFYLLEGLPLRLTVDAQIIQWDQATQDSTIDDNDFSDAENFSAGVEYRVDVSKKITLYPRAGIRRYDAPWDDPNGQALPGIGDRRLVIDTKDGDFIIGSVGLGVGWASEAGKSRSIDLAFDFGGDVNGFAMSFTFEM